MMKSSRLPSGTPWLKRPARRCGVEGRGSAETKRASEQALHITMLRCCHPPDMALIRRHLYLGMRLELGGQDRFWAELQIEEAANAFDCRGHATLHRVEWSCQVHAVRPVVRCHLARAVESLVRP